MREAKDNFGLQCAPFHEHTATLSMATDTGSKLGAEEKKQLRAIGHSLKPIVTVAGAGLTEGVLAELNRALDDHELIKVKIAVGDRELKHTTITRLCEHSGAILVQTIGNIALILRKAKKPDRNLSNLHRFKD